MEPTILAAIITGGAAIIAAVVGMVIQARNRLKESKEAETQSSRTAMGAIIRTDISLSEIMRYSPRTRELIIRATQEERQRQERQHEEPQQQENNMIGGCLLFLAMLMAAAASFLDKVWQLVIELWETLWNFFSGA